MIKAIFWDNDGVLVDTEHLYFEACRDALRQVKVELSLADFVHRSLNLGQSPLALATGQGVSEATLKNLRHYKNERYAQLLREGALPMEGVVETLSSLQGKVAMAIVTSSQRDHFELIHRPNGLLHYFDFILTREDYQNSKPDPEPYLKALEMSGFCAEECLVVEDTRRGLEAARRAGLRCVVLPNRLAPNAPFEGAFRVLRDLRELPSLIHGPNSSKNHIPTTA